MSQQAAMRDHHFAFLIEPGFTMQAFSSAIEVLRLARRLGELRFSYSVRSMDDGPVAASNGIEVLPNAPLQDLPRDAVVVAVAGAGAAHDPNPPLVARLRRWARVGHPVWGISSGVVRLAQAGLAEGRTVAVHWEDLPYLRDSHPEVQVTTSLFVLDSRYSTCAGGDAAADLMLNFIARNGSAALVEDIAARLMIDLVRDGRMRQSLPTELRFTTANKTVAAAIRLMDANRYAPLPLHEIARQAGVSQRQLERLFREAFAKTPKQVYSEMRLDEARQEILAGRRPITEIALDYGFEPAQFTKVYRRVFDALPSQERGRADKGRIDGPGTPRDLS